MALVSYPSSISDDCLAVLHNYTTDTLNSATTKYDAAKRFPKALQRSGYGVDDGVFYLLQDHLNSSSVIVNQAGTTVATNDYYPYGGNRGGAAFSGLSTKRFTGQYHENGLTQSAGLRIFDKLLAFLFTAHHRQATRRR